MITVTFTEFRQNASSLLTQVEQGETFVIIRHGKPIAEVAPYHGALAKTPAWKEPGVKLKTSGASLSAAILEERAAGEDLF